MASIYPNDNPTQARVNIWSDLVDFNIGKAWANNLQATVLIPYPSDEASAREYVANYIADLEVVPYNNRAEMEKHTEAGTFHLSQVVEQFKDDESDSFDYLVVLGGKTLLCVRISLVER